MNSNVFLNLLHKFNPNIGDKLLCQPYRFMGHDSYIHPTNIELIQLICPLQFSDDVFTMINLCGFTVYQQKYINMGQYSDGLYFNNQSFANIEILIRL